MAPGKPEEVNPRDAVEGSEASYEGTADGKQEQDSEPALRVNETSADSEVSGCAKKRKEPVIRGAGCGR
jgi:hypothetical protein